jgi:HlyD family secretion protein
MVETATMAKKTRYIAAAVILALLGVGVFAYQRSQREPTIHYDTTKVERGRIVAKITATGTLSALVTVLVGSQVSGRISHLMVDFNSTVKKGDVIAKIDPELFKAAVESARANYTAAQGNLAKAKAQAFDARRQFERSKALAERNLIATADRDTAESNADAMQAQVQAAEGAVAQAKASLHQSEVNLTYSTIVSPIDGVVISRSVDVGQTVAASLQAPTLFTIAEDLKKMQVDTSVAEADVGKLTADMPATFTVDAYPQTKFRGKVRQIRNAPTTVQNVVTYDAVIDVENADLKLKPGMTANVSFVYAEKDDALRVPNAALRFRPPQDLLPKEHRGGSAPAGSSSLAADRAAPAGSGRPRGGGRGDDIPDRRTVWVLSPSGPRPVPIRTGVSDGTLTEIVEGDVSAGDSIITQMTGPEDGTKPGAPPGGAAAPGGMRRIF